MPPTFKYCDIDVMCSECRRKMTRTLSLVEEQPDLVVTHKCWCLNSLCMATHELIYTAEQQGDGTILVSVSSHTVNGIPQKTKNILTGERNA